MTMTTTLDCFEV